MRSSWGDSSWSTHTRQPSRTACNATVSLVLSRSVSKYGSARAEIPEMTVGSEYASAPTWQEKDGAALPPEATIRLVGLIRSGLLKLEHFEFTEFGLDDVNKAVDHAAAHGGAFKMTVLRP